ncbi:MAG: TatD family hydrolase [Parabacteroides sp.]|nr:TatD family hydrolase [Parabacteroides sp.]
MHYFDFHTHLPVRPHSPEVDCCYNVIVGKDLFPDDRSCRYSCGIHPWYVEEWADPEALLRELCANHPVFAIGEAGLDKCVAVPWNRQLSLFRMQALLAESLQKPLIIHCVKAWSELLGMKREVSPTVPWLVHGFRGNGILAQQLLSHGLRLSFGPRFQPEAVRAAAPYGFGVETDDSGADIRSVYAALAAILEVTPERLPILCLPGIGL